MTAFGIATLACAVGTKLVGWIAVPVVGLLVGLAVPRENPVSIAAAGGAVGWGVLLLWGITRGPVMELADILGDVLGGVPGPVVILMTILLPACLAGAAAGIGSGGRTLGWDGAQLHEAEVCGAKPRLARQSHALL
jgi:hypothetical protein